MIFGANEHSLIHWMQLSYCVSSCKHSAAIPLPFFIPLYKYVNYFLECARKSPRMHWFWVLCCQEAWILFSTFSATDWTANRARGYKKQNWVGEINIRQILKLWTSFNNLTLQRKLIKIKINWMDCIGTISSQ